ncbi:hypothetical protein AALP_AA2G071800 [Arabis alpina]|uniref:Uncharacterized protein n=1 Tax=Arabis alpina TaxID=50452 RepID=A0A087HFU2_ARAAL|nr:hypothetical protein AALP_AA2G071800 [Arabis alpina]
MAATVGDSPSTPEPPDPPDPPDIISYARPFPFVFLSTTSHLSFPTSLFSFIFQNQDLKAADPESSCLNHVSLKKNPENLNKVSHQPAAVLHLLSGSRMNHPPLSPRLPRMSTLFCSSVKICLAASTFLRRQRTLLTDKPSCNLSVRYLLMGQTCVPDLNVFAFGPSLMSSQPMIIANVKCFVVKFADLYGCITTFLLGQ